MPVLHEPCFGRGLVQEWQKLRECQLQLPSVGRASAVQCTNSCTVGRALCTVGLVKAQQTPSNSVGKTKPGMPGGLGIKHMSSIKTQVSASK